jgi:hypothetical protein
MFEIAILIILMIGGSFFIISPKYEGSWMLALILVIYALGIISITLRTSFRRQGERRAVSTFLFGLVCGLCYGFLLLIILPEAANLNVVMMTSGMLVWGIAGGLIAVFCAYIISRLSFIKDLFRSIFSRDHNNH